MTDRLLSSFEESRQAARITILHEDLPTALCAKALFDCVAPQLDGAELELDYWRLDALRDPGLCSDSARCSQRAAIVVFSIGQRKTLPGELKKWLKEWMAHRNDHPCAFVVLLSRHGREEKSALLQYLRRAADKCGADFFCESCETRFSAPPLLANEPDQPTLTDLFGQPKRTDCWRVTA